MTILLEDVCFDLCLAYPNLNTTVLRAASLIFDLSSDTSILCYYLFLVFLVLYVIYVTELGSFDLKSKGFLIFKLMRNLKKKFLLLVIKL